MNLWELEQKIVIKALKDPAFKKRLLAQPGEALREFMKNENVNLPNFDKLNIRVIEEKKDEWVLTVPYFTEEMDTMSDEEINRMVVGTLFPTAWVGGCDDS